MLCSIGCLYLKNYLQIEVRSGVPQGSVLGPLLFLIFINDINKIINHSHRLLYADDLEIYIKSTLDCLEEKITKLQDDAENILNWGKINKLLLILKKAQAIAFGTRSEVEKFYSLKKVIYSQGQEISFSRSVKNLGIINQYCYLSWSEQIKKTQKSANYILYRLRHFRHVTDFSLRKKLVSSLVFPVLDYCAVSFGELNDCTQKIQNSCVRYITGAHYREYITPHRHQLGWLSTSKRRLFQGLVLLYKICKNEEPKYLFKKITPNDSSRPFRMTSRDFILPISKSEMYDKSFSVYIIRNWNSLPFTTRRPPSQALFKKNLYRHLIRLEHLKYSIISRL